MVLSNQLPAEKFGRDLVIKASDLELVADRPIGRPPKARTAKVLQSEKKHATRKKGGKK